MAGISDINLAQQTLADELDADRLAAAPDHFAVSSRPGVTREGQRQPGGQHVGILDRDLGAGGGHILHHALARREAAIEGDPAGLAQRFAHLALLGYGHLQLLQRAFPQVHGLGPDPRVDTGFCGRNTRTLMVRSLTLRLTGSTWPENTPAPSLLQRALRTVAKRENPGCLPHTGAVQSVPKNGPASGLPGRANATIRSPAAIGIHSRGSGRGTAPSQPQSLDLPGLLV